MSDPNRESRQNLSAAKIEIYKIDRRAEIYEHFFKTIRWVGVAYCVYLCIESLAGRSTFASFFVRFFATVEEGGVSKWWVAAAILFAAWAVGERVLRLRKVGAMSKRLEMLELTVDKGRTSSGLTRTGETPKSGKRRGD